MVQLMVEPIDENNTRVTAKSMATRKTHTIELPVHWERIVDWAAGNGPRYVQNAFPDLSASQREFLLTGTTQEEWDELFKEPEDIEDNPDQGDEDKVEPGPDSRQDLADKEPDERTK